MVILFLGTPGSGKDTQAEILAEQEGYLVVSTGSVMREIIAGGSDLGKQAEEISNSGKWLPDEMMYGMLEEYLKGKDISNLILTGAIRRETQIPMLDDLLQKSGAKLDKVLYFELSDEQAIERLSHRWFCPQDSATYDYQHKPPQQVGICDLCGTNLEQRADDTPVGIRGRMEEGRKTTGPILEAYAQRGILARVDASPSIDDVADNVKRILGDVG